MKNLIIALICLLVSPSLLAQYTIRGSVSNQNGERLESASVFIHGTSYMAASDPNGNFEISNIEAGSYLLKCTYLGYEDWVTNLTINENMSFDIVLNGTIFNMDEIVLNATWLDKDEPFAYTEIDEELIEKENLGQDVPYILKWTPSVVVNSDAGAGVGYTGMRIRGVDPTRINVTINGIPLNDSESQGVFWVDLPDFLSSVDNIQIQRGVGVSTNGAGAFGATVNLSTNKVRVNPYASIDAGYGSFNTTKFSGQAGTGLMNGKYTLDARVSKIDSEGYIDRATSDLSSIYFSAGRLDDKSVLKFNVIHGEEVTYQAWNGLPFQSLETDRTFNPSGTEKEGEPYDNEVDDYKQTHVQLLYDRIVSESVQINAGLHYTKGKGFFEQYKASEDLMEYGLSDTLLISDLVRRRWLDNDFYGVILNAEKQWSNQSLTVGGAYNIYKGGHFGNIVETKAEVNIPLDFRYYDNDATKKDANIYAQWKYQVNAQFNTFIDLQGRMIQYDFLGIDNNFNNVQQSDDLFFFNPKAGAQYSFNEGFKTQVSFAVANKEPGRNEYTDSTPNSRPSSERLYDTEIGIEYQNDRLSLGLNLYNMQYKDQLVPTGQINDVGAVILNNVDKSYRRGVEFLVGFRPMEDLNFQHSSTWSKNKIDSFDEGIDSWDTGDQIIVNHSDTDLAFSPELIMANQIEWSPMRNQKHELYLGLSNKFVGSQFIDNTSSEFGELPAYNYTDLNISYKLLNKWSKALRINLKVNNIFDQKYVSNAWIYRFESQGYNPVPDDLYARSEGDGRYNLTGLYPQAGIHFLLGIGVDF